MIETIKIKLKSGKTVELNDSEMTELQLYLNQVLGPPVNIPHVTTTGDFTSLRNPLDTEW